MTDLKPPWHLRPAIVGDYSDVFDAEGSPVAHVCQPSSDGHAAVIVAAPELLAQRDELLAAPKKLVTGLTEASFGVPREFHELIVKVEADQ